MKASRIVLYVFLTAVLYSTVWAAIRGSGIPSYCCENFTSKRIPRKLVETYELTKSSCPLSAVIFITKKGQKVCSDPEAKWVQNYVASLKSQEIPT